jgi:hypothetical protein
MAPYTVASAGCQVYDANNKLIAVADTDILSNHQRKLVQDGGNKATKKNSWKVCKISLPSFYFLLFTFALLY